MAVYRNPRKSSDEEWAKIKAEILARREKLEEILVQAQDYLSMTEEKPWTVE